MNRRIVEFLPEAVAEARAARQWYSARDATAASAFVAEIDFAVARIADAPERWPVFASGLRRYVLRRFPFSIVYRHSASTVTVIAVMHARRRPGYWHGR